MDVQFWASLFRTWNLPYWKVTKLKEFTLWRLCTTFDRRLIFTRKSNVAKYFFDVCNAEIAVLPEIWSHFSNKVV